MDALRSARLFRRFIASSGALGLILGLGVSACADEPQESCSAGTFGCECFGGGLCLAGLTCLSNICVDPSGGEETGDPTGDGDGDPTGDGDGDPTGDGDGDPTGDGDGDPTGDGDGDPTGDGDGDDPTGDPPGDPCDGPEVLLYSQDTDDGGTGYGILAGRFTDIGGTSVELADDFTVPAQDQCWCITKVEVRGFYSAIPPITPNVTVDIWNDANGNPGAVSLWSNHGQPVVPALGDFIINAPDDAIVPAGKHWLSFRPSLDSNDAFWYWGLETTTSGSQAHVRDSSEILFDGRTMWTPAQNCFSALEPPYQFSLQFDIHGVVGGTDCN